VLPCGTANNIARSLGQMHALPEVVAGITNPRVRELDLGMVHDAAGTHRFVEAVGLGLFVELLQRLKRPEVKAALQPEGPPEQELVKLRGYLEAIAKGFQGVGCRLSADGEAFSGRFLLAEVMNMKFMGPNLALAPAADPGDGWLDLVLVRAGQRQEVVDHLEGLQRGQVKDLAVERRRCREIIFHELPSALHVDDEVREAAAPPVSVGLDPQALTYVRVGGEG
jgi:diacylglycerol kinase family enzyme